MSDTSTAVTIGLPFYNCASYLLDAVRSIFAQTHQNWELILVDDGSTDGSLALALSIEDPRVRVESDGRNLGLAARLNQIVKMAKHDLVARMDADDLMHPQRLTRQIEVLDANPGADLVGTGTYSMMSDETLLGLRLPDKAYPSLEDAISGNSGLIHASVIYRRNWALRNAYDPSIRRAQDTDLWIRAAARQDLRSLTIAEPLYIYREDLNVTRDKLLASYAVRRACILRHIHHPIRLIKHLGQNLAKTAIVSLFFSSHLRRRLHQRRNPSPATPVMADRFAVLMEAIKGTPVPGVSDAELDVA